LVFGFNPIGQAFSSAEKTEEDNALLEKIKKEMFFNL